MNKLAILFLALVVAWQQITISRLNDRFDFMSDRIESLAEQFREATAFDKGTAEAILAFYEEYSGSIEVYDNNVDITKELFAQVDDRLTTVEDAVIEIIKVIAY